MIKYHIPVFVLILGLSSTKIFAQKGQYVSVFGIGQYTRIANSNDYFRQTIEIVPKDTYKPAFGVRYINNFENSFGFEAGLHYALQGQNYRGTIEYDDTLLIDPVNYTSSVTLSYFKIPVMFRFNSTLDNDEKVFLTIAAGFQFEILSSVDFETSPPPENNDVNIKLKDLYNNFTFSFVADAIFNIKLSEKVFLHSGIKLDRGMTDIENKGYHFPANTPVEYRFPVSTKKGDTFNYEVRDDFKTNNIVFGLQIGVSYKFAE